MPMFFLEGTYWSMSFSALFLLHHKRLPEVEQDFRYFSLQFAFFPLALIVLTQYVRTVSFDHYAVNQSKNEGKF